MKVTYQQVPNSQPYAQNNLILNKDKKDETRRHVKSQSEVISDLLKGDYQSVFDHFMVRFALTGNFDLSTKFMMELRKIDETLSFRSKEEESLYKLKELQEAMETINTVIKSIDERKGPG